MEVLDSTMKKQIRIADKQMELLREVVFRRNPDLSRLLCGLGTRPLTDVEREELREAVGTEFCDTGLQDNSEPNERGLALERLIDLLGHL